MKVSDRGSTANEQPTLEFAVAFATAQVAEADAKLMRAKAGTYPEDLAVAQAEEVAAAREVDALTVQTMAADVQIRQAEVARDLLIVRAPIAGTVLRLDTRPGEYRAAGPNAGALLRR
jgi:multidrug resistance efflux pump